MPVYDLKKDLKSLIDKEESLTVLRAIKILLEKHQPDWWEEISDEERSEIKESIEEANRGEVIPHDEVMKNPKKWLSK
ncbi:MAG: hypothetical protein EA412_08470 [Chitinophagaceae bacterium]|nr:MAG: hypothetical protein EA412_08470 [Chitinophagaceae bacterium]